MENGKKPRSRSRLLWVPILMAIMGFLSHEAYVLVTNPMRQKVIEEWRGLHREAGKTSFRSPLTLMGVTEKRFDAQEGERNEQWEIDVELTSLLRTKYILSGFDAHRIPSLYRVSVGMQGVRAFFIHRDNGDGVPDRATVRLPSTRDNGVYEYLDLNLDGELDASTLELSTGEVQTWICVGERLLRTCKPLSLGEPSAQVQEEAGTIELFHFKEGRWKLEKRSSDE